MACIRSKDIHCHMDSGRAHPPFRPSLGVGPELKIGSSRETTNAIL